MGRFFLGFAIGVAIGAAAVALATPRPDGQREGLQQLFDSAMDVGKRAANRSEQQLWTEYRTRITNQSDAAKRKQNPYAG